jgi:hypothetical protein
MRKKPKTFRIDSRAPATSMVKFSARSDSKNFPYKNRPSRGPIKSQNFFFVLSSSQNPDGGFVRF